MLDYVVGFGPGSKNAESQNQYSASKRAMLFVPLILLLGGLILWIYILGDMWLNEDNNYMCQNNKLILPFSLVSIIFYINIIRKYSKYVSYKKL